MRICKLLLATACSTVLMTALVGSASAGRLSTSSQAWRAAFREWRIDGVFGNITCQLSLEGSLHARTITKAPGSLVGYITRADLGPCAESRRTILRETLPWHVRYLSFAGTLPSITGLRVNIIGFAFRIQEPLAGCLARATAESPANLTLNRNTTTGAVESTELGGTIPTDCGLNGSFTSNRAPVTVLNGTARITITLI